LTLNLPDGGLKKSVEAHLAKRVGAGKFSKGKDMASAAFAAQAPVE